MVMLYMGGGADTFNLLVPQDCSLAASYTEARGSVAMGCHGSAAKVGVDGPTLTQSPPLSLRPTWSTRGRRLEATCSAVDNL